MCFAAATLHALRVLVRNAGCFARTLSCTGSGLVCTEHHNRTPAPQPIQAKCTTRVVQCSEDLYSTHLFLLGAGGSGRASLLAVARPPHPVGQMATAAALACWQQKSSYHGYSYATATVLVRVLVLVLVRVLVLLLVLVLVLALARLL